MWMVASTRGLAPYWGITRTRKEMAQRVEAEVAPPGWHIVRVLVAEESTARRTHG